MTKTMRSVILFISILAMLSLALPARSVQAIAIGCTWLGTEDANWSTPDNWGPGCTGVGHIPGTGDMLTFPVGGLHPAMNADLSPITLAKLVFSGSTDYTLTGSNTISLSVGIDVQAGTQAINAPLAVVNNSSIYQVASGAALNIGGTITLSANTLTTAINTGAGVTGMTITGSIAGGTNQSNRGKITKVGSGDLRLTGNSQLAYWDIDLNVGTISTNPSAPTFLPAAGIATLATGTNINLLNSGTMGSIAGAGDLHFSSFFQVREQQQTTFTGDLFGNLQLAVLGPGHLTIDRSGGSLSYNGEINVNAGPGYLTLVNTTATSVSDFQVNGSSTNSILELINSHVGLVKLGFASDGFIYGGTLRLSGALMNSVSQVVVQTDVCSIESVLNSTVDYGKMTETSAVDFASHPVKFKFSGTGIPEPNFVYEVVHNTNSGTAINGGATFSGLPQGGWLMANGGVVKADYQAVGNTSFALTGGWAAFLPIVIR